MSMTSGATAARSTLDIKGHIGALASVSNAFVVIAAYCCVRRTPVGRADDGCVFDIGHPRGDTEIRELDVAVLGGENVGALEAPTGADEIRGKLAP